MRAVIAGIVLAFGFLAAPAFADDAAPPGAVYSELAQTRLSAAQVENYIAAAADMRAAMGDPAADAPEPDVKTMAKLDNLAMAHGFRDFADYNTVAGNIQLVLDGIDPESKTYIGPEKVIEKSITQVKADKQMAMAEKQAALADLQTQWKAVLPLKFASNIDLVMKNYDKLSAD